MNAHVKDVVREMSEASDEERITFPEVVKALMEVGIERYHADLLGSGLIDHSQNMTAAAMQIAEK